MGLLNWFKNEVRVNRAEQIKKDKRELKQLESHYHQTEDVQKRIRKLDGRIARNEERQKIASENNLKPNSTTKNVSLSNNQTFNNGINTKIDLSQKTKKK